MPDHITFADHASYAVAQQVQQALADPRLPRDRELELRSTSSILERLREHAPGESATFARMGQRVRGELVPPAQVEVTFTVAARELGFELPSLDREAVTA